MNTKTNTTQWGEPAKALLYARKAFNDPKRCVLEVHIHVNTDDEYTLTIVEVDYARANARAA